MISETASAPPASAAFAIAVISVTFGVSFIMTNIEYLFTEVGMNRIAARHDPNNPHSGGVMRKCGMVYEGTTRASDKNNQGICDAAHYAILRRDRA